MMMCACDGEGVTMIIVSTCLPAVITCRVQVALPANHMHGRNTVAYI